MTLVLLFGLFFLCQCFLFITKTFCIFVPFVCLFFLSFVPCGNTKALQTNLAHANKILFTKLEQQQHWSIGSAIKIA